MAYRTSFIPVLAVAALIAGAAVTRASQAPAQPPLEKPAAAKPAAQKPATAKPVTQKPSTAKAGAEKPATASCLRCSSSSTYRALPARRSRASRCCR